MFAKAIKTFDAVLDLGFTAFKKVLWVVVLAAAVSAIITATIMILGFNVIQ